MFRLWLRKEKPVKVSPVKIRLSPKTKSVQVRVRRYPLDQKKIMDTYFSKLVEYGYIKPNPSASWKAAPNVVPKGKCRYCLTIEMRPVNAITIS